MDVIREDAVREGKAAVLRFGQTIGDFPDLRIAPGGTLSE